MTAWSEQETMVDGDGLERRKARVVARGERVGRVLGLLAGWTVVTWAVVLALVLLTAGLHYLVRVLSWAWGWSG